jgi:hypothetical protein
LNFLLLTLNNLTIMKHAPLLLLLAASVQLSSCKKQVPGPDAGNFNSVTEIMKTVNPSSLTSNLLYRTEIDKAAVKIAAYLQKQGVDTREFNSLTLFTYGLFLAAHEKHPGIPLQLMSRELLDAPGTPIVPDAAFDAMNCFWVAVGTIIGIAQAKTIWAGVASGSASLAQTAVAALGVIAKRVAWGAMTVYAIYEAGQCLDLWDLVRYTPYENDSLKLPPLTKPDGWSITTQPQTVQP